MKRRFTSRGFEDFAEFTDSYGSQVVVRESSIIGEPCIWVFCKNSGSGSANPSPHLTVAQAQLLVDGLQKFILRARPRTPWFLHWLFKKGITYLNPLREKENQK
jgi:hypothetical protein